MKRLVTFIFLIVLTMFVLSLPVSANDIVAQSPALTETILANEVPTAIVVHDFQVKPSGIELVFIVQGLIIGLGTMMLLHPACRAMLVGSIGRKPQLRQADVKPEASSPLAVAPITDKIQ